MYSQKDQEYCYLVSLLSYTLLLEATQNTNEKSNPILAHDPRANSVLRNQNTNSIPRNKSKTRSQSPLLHDQKRLSKEATHQRSRELSM